MQAARAIEQHETLPETFPISYPSGVSWFVVRTNIKCEFRAEMGLKAQGYKTFLPVEKVWIRHARRKSEKVRPLFSRYLFVGFDPNKTAWTPIRETDGVESLLVSVSGIPSPVPMKAIETLRGAIEVGVFDETRTGWQGAKPGDPLLLVEGPFRDFVVALKQSLPEKRVEIVLNLFGAERVLKVPLAWVRPAS